MEDTTPRLSAAQASPGDGGFLVLTGDPDGPATGVARDLAGREVRATSAEEAMRALGGGHHYSHVELIEHDFPDVDGGTPHVVKVWVPVNAPA